MSANPILAFVQFGRDLLVGVGVVLLGECLETPSGLDRVEVGAMDVLDQRFRVGITRRERDLLTAGDLGRPQPALTGDKIEAAIGLRLHPDGLDQAGLIDGPCELFELLSGELLARIEIFDDVDQVYVNFGGCELAHASNSFMSGPALCGAVVPRVARGACDPGASDQKSQSSHPPQGLKALQNSSGQEGIAR